MPKYIIERNVPGASRLTRQELRDLSGKSNSVVVALNVPYKWITSYVAGDMIYCVHEAESADVIIRHAETAGFPADKVTEIASIIGPHTAEGFMAEAV
jgi:hypothetical protein